MNVATLAAAAAVVAFTAVSTNTIMCSGAHRESTSPLFFSSLGSANTTCAAWPAAKRSIDTASALPPGWYWDTPSGGTNARDHGAVVSHALDLFASHVAATDPAPVTRAAHSYITAKRVELIALAARTFDDTVASRVTLTRAGLNRACGLPDTAAGPI